MPAGSTYTPIATTTLASDTNSYTFTSIPTTYTDLILIGSFSTSSSVDLITAQVGNSSVDTGTNYSITYLLGTGSAASSGRFSNQTYAALSRNLGGSPTAGGINFIAQFMNYSNTTTNKTILSRVNQADGLYPGTEASVNLWRSTSAINTIKVAETGGVIKAGSTFTLYGIASA